MENEFFFKAEYVTFINVCVVRVDVQRRTDNDLAADHESENESTKVNLQEKVFNITFLFSIGERG